MGANVRTITTYTCDICHQECGPNDSCIAVEIHPGDGRDVGPSSMTAKLSVDFQYGVSNGICCNACKAKFLREYVAGLDDAIAAQRQEGL